MKTHEPHAVSASQPHQANGLVLTIAWGIAPRTQATPAQGSLKGCLTRAVNASQPHQANGLFSP